MVFLIRHEMFAFCLCRMKIKFSFEKNRIRIKEKFNWNTVTWKLNIPKIISCISIESYIKFVEQQLMYHITFSSISTNQNIILSLLVIGTANETTIVKTINGWKFSLNVTEVYLNLKQLWTDSPIVKWLGPLYQFKRQFYNMLPQINTNNVRYINETYWQT